MRSALNDLAIAKKLMLVFGLIGLAIAGLAATALLGERNMHRVGDRNAADVAALSQLAEVANDVRDLRIVVYSFYNYTSEAERVSLEARFAEGHAGLQKHFEEYAAVADPANAEQVAALGEAVTHLRRTDTRLFELRQAGDLGGAFALLKGEAKAASTAVREQTQALFEKSRENVRATGVTAQQASSQAITSTLVLVVLSLATLLVSFIALRRSVVEPLANLVSVTGALAKGEARTVPFTERKDDVGDLARSVAVFRDAAVAREAAERALSAEQRQVNEALAESLDALRGGNLTHAITVEFPEAYAAIKENYNAAVAGLCEVVAAVQHRSDSINTGSAQIAQASDDLARRTESNAASLEETSAAVTEIAGRVQASAGAAARTVSRADEAIGAVGEGRDTAAHAVDAMGRVSESAKGIDKVIEGLDKIAFQTRVLAMNAAVEAGRAGEAGRGFAVVADLVSALAMRAEEEAKSARDQLTVTQDEVATAVDAVQKVDGALDKIVGNVDAVHKLLRDMAEDNQAQSAAIAQVSSAVTAMDSSTQQNAAMVEQTSAAAQSLMNEAMALATQTQRFEVGATAPARAAQPASDDRVPGRTTRARTEMPAIRQRAPAPAEEWAAF